MKKKTPQQYDAMVQKASPHSPALKNCLFAFLSGGAICTLGQALANTFMLLGLDLKDARTCVSISLIFISAALTAYGVYDNISEIRRGRHAGSDYGVCELNGLPCAGI